MHQRSKAQPKVEKLYQWPIINVLFHVIWLVNLLEVLYLTHKFWLFPNVYMGINIAFNIICLAASLVYANYYHTRFGNNIVIMSILCVFAAVSVIFFLIVTILEIIDLVSMEGMDKEEFQDSIKNILLFSVPILHCL